MLCAPEKPAAKMSTNINFLFRSRLVTDDIYWVTVVFSEACTGMVLNKSQISIPQNKPGTILPCSTNLHPITPIREPAMIGPNVSPILPPVPCKAIAKPLLEVNSLANEDMAAGCQNVIATLNKEENTTAVQKPLDSPNATANTDTKIMEPPSITARCFGY